MKKRSSNIIFYTFTIVFIVSFVLQGCKSSRTLKGGAIGAGVGGAVGAAIGSKSDNTAKGAILGAVIGGTAGALIGKYMDRQAEELEKTLEGATVERVGEGIKITFHSGIQFDFNSSELRDVSKENLSELAETLKKYDDTNVLIEGHTDNVGEDDYNEKLSDKRASSVADYLATLDVKRSRFIIEGYGESQPVAENTTDSGRQLNRRVEVAIYANDKLKKAAEKGQVPVSEN